MPPIFTFQSEGYDGLLDVSRFSGQEGISRLFHFGLELVADDNAIDLDAVVSKPAVLDLHSNTSVPQSINGIISSFGQGVAGHVFTPYFAELVPAVWPLTQRLTSRIFQNETVPQIVAHVLEAAGIQTSSYRISLQRTDYVQREFCVQYRESDWNFISRLLEEEGIFYFFDHFDSSKLVIADSKDVHVPIDFGDGGQVLYRDPTGLVEVEEYVYDFRFSQQIRPGKVALRDFHFVTPAIDLTKDDSAERDPELEVYEFPGLYVDPAPGGILAGIRLEAAQARRLTGIGRSVCRAMEPGQTFELLDHPRDSFNAKYLITSVHHEGTQPLGIHEGSGGRYEYNNRFRCMPSDVPFRPQRVTPKPVVEGSQTAIVTGPDGEEIHVDEHGRVKVRFHWDRGQWNGDAWQPGEESCWIRVSQLWAGAGWGAMFIPRIGHEVIVDFIEGDPDRPIIVGRVYHGTNQPPYPLDAEKTKSTIKSDSSKGHGGSNEYRFEDLKGSEEIYQHAQKDLTIKTENDKNQNTGHDETLTIGHDRTKTVKHDEKTTVENDRTETVNGNEKITIKKDRTEEIQEGNEKVTINTGNRTINVNTGNDEHNILTGNRTVNVNTGNDALNILTGNRTVNVNAGNEVLNVLTGTKTDSIKGPYDVTVQSGQFHLKCGSSELTMKDDGTVTIKGAQGTITIDKTGVKIEGQNIKSVATLANDTSGQMVSSAGQAKNVVSGGMVLLNP